MDVGVVQERAALDTNPTIREREFGMKLFTRRGFTLGFALALAVGSSVFGKTPRECFPASVRSAGLSDATGGQIAPGVTYFSAHFSKLYGHKNWIRVLEIDLKSADVSFFVYENQDTPKKNVETTTAVAAKYNALAAVNGTFFDMGASNIPWFSVKSGGKELNKNGAPGGIAFGPGKKDVSLGDFDPARYKACTDYIGTYPLMTKGKAKVTDKDRSNSDRHPRTFAGMTPDKVLYFVICEGRSKQSDGMNSWEETEFLKALGCVDGVNLDGGGSSTLALRKSVARKPWGGTVAPTKPPMVKMNTGGERQVVDHILILDAKSKKPSAVK